MNCGAIPAIGGAWISRSPSIMSLVSYTHLDVYKRQVLSRLGVFDELAHERHVFQTTPAAIAHARTHASRTIHTPTDPSPPGG